MRYSITKRLLGSVLALIIPLLLLQGAVYLWARSAMLEEIESSAESNLEYLQKHLDRQIQGIYQAANGLIESRKVGMFYTQLHHASFASTSEYYMSIRDVREQMDILKYANEMIREITLLFPGYESFVSTTSSASENIVLPSDMPKIYAAAQNQPHLLMEIGGKLYSVFGKPHESELEKTGLMLCIELNQNVISDILASYSQDKGKSAFLYISATGALLSSPFAPTLREEQLRFLFPTGQGSGIAQRTLTIDGQTHTVFWRYSSLLGAYILQTVPTQQFNRVPAAIGLLMIILCLTTLIVLIVLLHVVSRTVTQPVRQLKTAFSKAGKGDFSTRLPEQRAEEFNQLSQGFNAMAEHIDSLIDTNYRQTIRLQTTELKKLQAQINPHFLYNSFYSLRHLISSEETNSAEEFCRYLGRYFQYIARNDQNTIPLREEYEHAVNYLNIQLMRFGDTVQAEVPQLPASLGEIETPRLIVEPVVENCFKHGLNSQEEVGRIRISLSEDQQGADIIIENNGGGLTDQQLRDLEKSLQTPTEEASFTGLVNTHHRLRLFYGGDAGVSVSRSPLGGLRVKLRILKSRRNPELEGGKGDDLSGSDRG